LILAAITVNLIEGRYLIATVWACAASVISASGLMHGFRLPMETLSMPTAHHTPGSSSSGILSLPPYSSRYGGCKRIGKNYPDCIETLDNLLPDLSLKKNSLSTHQTGRFIKVL